MRFGLFYEHQLPRPWKGDSEYVLFKNALEQIEIADRLGFDCVWLVEHHFLEEYSHSSAPEVFLAAASQRTQRIRLGHGIVQIPPRVNHPARVAERVATLDLLSDGRVEFGTGESSSAGELGGFLVDRRQKRAQWEDAIDAITRMLVEEPFAGHESQFLQMPVRNVVPKPRQKPHPPLWVACSRRETIHFAARKGMGALSFAFVDPEEAAKWVNEYYTILRSRECVPAGFAVNPNVAVVLPMMVHTNEETAIERGIDGAHFFGYSLAHYYGFARHQPARTVVWDEFQQRRESTGFSRTAIRANREALGVKVLEATGLGSLRGAIGTTRQVTDLLRRYEAAGVDQVIFLVQAGRNRHEDVCESLDLFAREVLPSFAANREAGEAAKAARLAPAVEAALARRAPPRAAPPYEINELGEMKRANRARRTAPPEPRLRKARESADEWVRGRMHAMIVRAVRGKSDAEIETRFRARVLQQALFSALARGFNPKYAFGFLGEIEYELVRSNGSSTSTVSDLWTLRVDPNGASAQMARGQDPALKIRMPLADFVRMLAGEVPPLEPVLEGRAVMQGDLNLSSRLTEMFGGPSNL